MEVYFLKIIKHTRMLPIQEEYMSTRVAFVVQRYGTEITGGAEWYTRAIAEKLHQQGDIEVDIYTTTCSDYTTWAHSYPEGSSIINGLTVHRFKPQSQRNMIRFRIMASLLKPSIRFCNFFSITKRLGWNLEKIFFNKQGPLCPDLIETLHSNQEIYRKIFFTTYLYYPTIFGLPKMARKSILIPTAHQEAPFYFQHTEAILKTTPAIFANTIPESQLITSRLPSAKDKISIVGIGIDIPKLANIEQGPSIEGPYLLYLGRISKAKGINTLLEMFDQISQRYPNIQLILAGSIDDTISVKEKPNVKFLGFVSEKEKYQLIKNAICVVNPSSLESLSIIVIEAMLLKIPIVVNGHCNVLDYYATKAETVFSYTDEITFKEAITSIIQHKPTQEKLERTKSWATHHFSWQQALSVFRQSIQS